MPPKAGDAASVTSCLSPRSKDSSSPRQRKASTSPPAKKARTSAAAGSRGVANLTPEQLAKKRANDREAQRAIRERTRTQIETLERRIQELTSQQPYQELQQAIRQKEIVEAENVEIKRRLQAVMAIVQPLLEGNALTGLSTPGLDGPRTDSTRSGMGLVFGANGASESYSPSSVTTAGDGIFASRHYPNVPYSTPWQGSTPAMNEAVMGHTHQMSNMRQGRPADPDPSVLRTTSAERMALGLMSATRSALSGSPASMGDGGNAAGSESVSGGRRVSLPSDSHITLGRSTTGTEDMVPANGSPAVSAGHSAHTAAASSSIYRSAEHAAPLSALPPHPTASCPLVGILLDFLAERRRLAASGVSETELAGPPYPDFTFFMLPASVRKQRRAEHPLSQMLTDVILTFPDIRASPEKVATYYGMYLVLRWLAHPTQAHFDRLLPFNQPTAWQLLTPHPVWIDCLPWPDMRDRLVHHHARYPFDEFFVPFTKTLGVNWPYDDAAVFRQPPAPDPVAGATAAAAAAANALTQLDISPLFEEHIRDIRNWSLGSAFALAFPALAPASVRMVDRPQSAEKN